MSRGPAFQAFSATPDGHHLFDLREIPMPGPENTHWPDALLWKTQSYRLAPKDRPEWARSGIRVTSQCVPEGLLLMTVCLSCGGRSDVLVDLRHDPVPKTWADAERQMGPLLDKAYLPVRDEWMPAHADCAAHPRPWRLPTHVDAFVTERVADARRKIGRGESAHSTVFLMLTDGTGVGYSIADVPDAVDKASAQLRARVLRGRIFGVREYLRAKLLTAEAVVFVGEAWKQEEDADAYAEERRTGRRTFYPITAPNRTEVVVVGVRTAEFGVNSFRPITRYSGRIGEGRGLLGADAWRPDAGPSAAIDGTLVRSFQPVADAFAAVGQSLL